SGRPTAGAPAPRARAAHEGDGGRSALRSDHERVPRWCPNTTCAEGGPNCEARGERPLDERRPRLRFLVPEDNGDDAVLAAGAPVLSSTRLRSIQGSGERPGDPTTGGAPARGGVRCECEVGTATRTRTPSRGRAPPRGRRPP